MKYSFFNIKIEGSAKSSILYNTLSDMFIVMKKELLEKYPNPVDSPCLDKLISGGFVVEDSVDEIAEYIKKARAIETDNKYKHIIINPTINCNFNCWYCYEMHTPSKMDVKTFDNLKKYISKSCEECETLVLSFFGGEPLLYYDEIMIPLLEYAYEMASKKGIEMKSNCTSNGYLFNLAKVKNLKHYNFNFAQITLDGGKSFHDKTRTLHGGKGTFDKIVENIKILARENIDVTVRINYTKENILSAQEIPCYFAELTDEQKKHLYFSFHKVWQEDDDPIDEASKVIQSFSDAGFVASRNILGSYCYGDLRNSSVINYNGDVYKCTAVDFNNVKRDGYLDENGCIVWENESLEERMRKKFSNKPCLNCKILPICHGGCSSRPLLAAEDYCIFDFDEDKKMQSVLEKLDYNIKYKWNSK